MVPPRRKKWTEEEERTLIGKYEEMLSDNTLSKFKTREKKFRPIAAHVNYLHHSRDPISYQWQWSWKDVSTKVQNMRHQYRLVKQKIRKPEAEEGVEIDWNDGLSHWSNFLRYKNVFGDFPLEEANQRVDILQFMEESFGVGENSVLGLGLDFEYDGEECDDCNINNNVHCNLVKKDTDECFEYEELDSVGPRSKKKRKKMKTLEKQFAQLREREAQLEDCEAERAQERQRREQMREEREQEWDLIMEERKKEKKNREQAREMARKDNNIELETLEKESGERERLRRDERLKIERDWEERMDQRRLEWKKMIDDMMSHHRAAMDQMQLQILHDQQTITTQLLGVLSQWTTQNITGLSHHNGATANTYLSQLIQSLHNLTGMVHSENRIVADNQDDHFIVDG
ncbi:hypothetical protein GIB67_028937 [Kingdonia uniflora]|uniref:Uncharacterized protein n=1 Tax=Kingdonia uniflora TaxID=39325 RepID=A0A7J7LBS5_9MAGN|nr:hypothetical protein GIB67_028937 [Kingdonia uniflora]